MARLCCWSPVWCGSRLLPEESAVLKVQGALEQASAQASAVKAAYRQVLAQVSVVQMA
jgi:hypothetical protein